MTLTVPDRCPVEGFHEHRFDGPHRLAAPAVTETDLRAAVARMRYHPDLRGKSAEYVAGWDAATRAMADWLLAELRKVRAGE